MKDHRTSPDDVEWHKERAAIIWEGAGEVARESGKMTELWADRLAMEELGRRKQVVKAKTQQRMFGKEV